MNRACNVYEEDTAYNIVVCKISKKEGRDLLGELVVCGRIVMTFVIMDSLLQ
jgi:hypothetical protein